MCGIVGFIADQIAPSDVAVLRRMVCSIRHRGPDAARVQVDENAALGHARLSIIDLAGGSQPMHNEDRSLWIVFNGEIFNYVELRRELVGKGHRFATHSDTEVIVHLFEELGDACVSRLNGQWAFAIWNTRRRQLFLSRDRLGVRPLFFTVLKDCFIFASEIKALFAHPGVTRKLDVRALDEIFTFWHTLPPRTAFCDVCELPAGHSLTVTAGKVTVKPYWELDYPPPSKVCCEGVGEEERYAEELLEILKDATRLRLRSDVPVGAYLSGGLDSTLVAALARQSGVSQLKTFSVRFEENDLDEGVFQNEAVRYLATDHQEIRCSKQEIGRVFPEVIWHTEKPILRTAPAPLYLLSRLARDNGCNVVLTGEGSDELLGGYDIFKEAKIRAFWAARPDSSLRPLLLRQLYPYAPTIQSQPPAYLKAFFHIGRDDTHSMFFSHLPRWRLTSKLKCFFSNAVKAELAGYDAIAAMETLLPDSYKGWNPFVRAQYLEARYLLPGYILSSEGDRVAMAHAVEGRFPFLDFRLAEFASRLPSRLKMSALKEKYLLKRCAAGLVPAAVINRPKQPFRAPDADSFFRAGRNEYVEELVSPDRIRRDEVFNPAAVEKLVKKARNGSVLGVGDNMAVVGILSTQLLIDKFIRVFDPVP